MRLLLLGDTSTTLDEGAKNVANHLTRMLAKRHEVLQIYQRAIRFRPQVVMSVQGPSVRTVGLLALLRVLCGRPRTLAIGAQPSADKSLLRLLRWLPPDCLFAQRKRWLDRFQASGAQVRRLPNGVNLSTFRPPTDAAAVAALRAELGLAPGRRVALHVGPLNDNRNHELLIRLHRESDWQVLVVGSTTAPFVPEVKGALDAVGVVVTRRYFEDIALVYALADAYVFPVTDPTGSIEFPLTVLEAMACDRPVVSTRFLALQEYLDEGPAFAYFDATFEALKAALERVVCQTGNRDRVAVFDWERVVKQEVASLPAGAGQRERPCDHADGHRRLRQEHAQPRTAGRTRGARRAGRGALGDAASGAGEAADRGCQVPARSRGAEGGRLRGSHGGQAQRNEQAALRARHLFLGDGA